jgi:hypothetical protein
MDGAQHALLGTRHLGIGMPVDAVDKVGTIFVYHTIYHKPRLKIDIVCNTQPFCNTLHHSRMPTGVGGHFIGHGIHCLAYKRI